MTSKGGEMKQEITKEQFQEYKAVRVSGVTNMNDTRNVMACSSLDKEIIIAIMSQYSELMVKYPDVRKP